jgi:hypothetical protein
MPKALVVSDEVDERLWTASVRAYAVDPMVRTSGRKPSSPGARKLVRIAERPRRKDGRGVDVLLTHAPPLGLGDRDDPPHRGFECLHRTVGQLRPKWLLHGHIHPHGERGPDRTAGETRLRNVVGHRVRTMHKDTGFPKADAEHDFLRACRRQVLSRLAKWLRGEPDDVNIMLPFNEVVDALGHQGEQRIGLRVIKLDSIVGSVDRGRDFDRRFRPTSGRVGERWERLALAARRGAEIPPIEVYRIGDLHFIIDGHHRVSVAHALGLSTIEANVTEVRTKLNPSGIRYRGDLIVKDYRRLFLERVPLTGHARASIVVSDPEHYAQLGEHVEAWGFRLMQDEAKFLDRATVARRWYEEEHVPVVEMLRRADMVRGRTEAEAYPWVAGERYRLIRTHRWDDEVSETLRTQSG